MSGPRQLGLILLRSYLVLAFLLVIVKVVTAAIR